MHDNKESVNNRHLTISKDNSISRPSNSPADEAISLHKKIGNQAIGSLLQSRQDTFSTDLPVQRQTYSDDGMLEDLPPTTGCECDCENYGTYVARVYANKHLRYPSWYGEKPRPFDLDLYWWHCHYYRRYSPCSWMALVVFEERNHKTKYSVFVQLVNNRFYVGTHSGSFPVCTYDFECDSSGSFTKLKLTEVGCRERLYIPPGL